MKTFQSPIGTNKTTDEDLLTLLKKLFQSPIGTNKTYPQQQNNCQASKVSIPYRYKQNGKLVSLGYNEYAGFNPLQVQTKLQSGD